MRKSNFYDLNPFDNDIKKVIELFRRKILEDIDISQKYPKSLTPKGDILLTDPFFWILYIRMKVYYTDKIEEKKKTFIKLMNRATSSAYNIFNRSILYEYFIMAIMRLHPNKSDVAKLIGKQKNIHKMDFDRVEYNDFMLLLTNKSFFMKENTKTNFFLENMNTSVSSASNNNNSNERNKIINNNFLSLTDETVKDDTIQVNLTQDDVPPKLLGRKRKHLTKKKLQQKLK